MTEAPGESGGAPTRPWPGDAPCYEVRESPIAGRGLFARRDIAAGERIIEYVGERISAAEAERRYDDASMAVHHTFLFAVGDDECIDASRHGNEARFINHSCAPNCEAIESGGRVFVDAAEAIPAGRELLYDYQYTIDARMTRAEALRLYPCRCGAPKCRGSLAVLPEPRPRRPTSRTRARARSKPRR